MEGQISRHPPAELIREIIDSELSGALRLSREAAKIAVYFDAGKPIFAASNLRAHRLRETLQKSGIAAAQLEFMPATITDEDLAQALISSGEVTTETVQQARATQTGDVLRVALLWTDGKWQFDQRVRIPAELRVSIALDRLLLESARHLPFAFVKSRVADANAGYTLGENDNSNNLSPAESFVLSRATAAGDVFRLSDLSPNGLSEEDYLRGVYALSLSGILNRSDWEFALKITRPDKAKPKRAAARPKTEPPADDPVNVKQFLARMNACKDHYDVLDVPRFASADEIKDAYHKLARHYHPDRFHQSDEDLRTQVSSAFARIAQAYEVLSDKAKRATFDKKSTPKTAPAASKPETTKAAPAPAPATGPKKEVSRAESSFQRGMEAMNQNQFEQAIPLLAEAATLEPREARYRAQYGRALMYRPNNRRLAETELQAALSMEPNNASFRVFLAEFYQRVGLRRRAEGEAAKAIASDPNNQAARALLTSLKSK